MNRWKSSHVLNHVEQDDNVTTDDSLVYWDNTVQDLVQRPYRVLEVLRLPWPLPTPRVRVKLREWNVCPYSRTSTVVGSYSARALFHVKLVSSWSRLQEIIDIESAALRLRDVQYTSALECLPCLY
ncbi:hypothetical protein PsorP6_001386 [Peronosclerospora sorghi]|uniref:Uncharacterized protein n=1 Tax=Peronosclerospora sorghi TaxID=230839 RepID=A0ACC0WSM1_9STRA|nr:hypothetical protein PsorP6_001386 [Peronosclerospora sorghi]